MEEALARSPYLAGEAYSLGDAAATPYVNRAAMLAMDSLPLVIPLSMRLSARVM